MKQISALSVYSAGILIEGLASKCEAASRFIGVSDPESKLSMTLQRKTIVDATKVLDSLEWDCKTLNMKISGETLDDLRRKLKNPNAESITLHWLADQVRNLQRLILKEMKRKLFVYIQPETAKYFGTANEPDLFGKAVSVAFPSSRRDIEEAGAAIATMRYTASVFHQMRALEAGLTAFGDVFGVSLAHTNWGIAIDQIESKIRDMHKDPAWKLIPHCKDLQAKYAQAASTFGVVKDAWRNYTMHGRNFYDLAEAEHIFGNTRVFMQKLAALGLKEGGFKGQTQH